MAEYRPGSADGGVYDNISGTASLIRQEIKGDKKGKEILNKIDTIIQMCWAQWCRVLRGIPANGAPTVCIFFIILQQLKHRSLSQ